MSFELSDLQVPEGFGEQLKPMVTSTIEGIIDEDDLRELAAGCGAGDIRVADDNPEDLKKIREKHHHVARLIADGLNQRMVAQISGYTENYISILLNNPAMVELVEMYRMQGGAALRIATEKLKTVGLKALEKLDGKIDADELNATELTGVAKLGLDRGGLGPQSKVHNVNEQHVFDHAEIKRLNEEARRRNHEFVIPVEDIRAAIAVTEQKLLPKAADEAA